MDNETKREAKKVAGQWLMDIAKYILTAAIISSFLADMGQKWLFYVSGLVSVAICFFVGLYMYINKK